MTAHYETSQTNPRDNSSKGERGTADTRAVESVTHLMKRLLLSIARHADHKLAECGLTGAQSELLIKLREHESATVADLARGYGVDGGSMTRLLDRLAKKGFCKRVRSTADRRVVQIEITPRGAVAAESARGVAAGVLNAHLAGFTETEWRDLGGYLQRMREAGEARRAKS